ncbi:carbohydrate kinase [Candidatus Poribacteria bacterium]|nr:carbohydrate kinase [Candidatus Poribacteria bacterium]
MDRNTLEHVLNCLPKLQIAVVGDFFLDKYLIIDPELGEPSVETGLEAHQVVAKRLYPGAAGTVTSNLSALGVGTIHAVGIIGRDGEGYELKKGLADRRVRIDALIETEMRVTPTYTKPMRRLPDGSEEELNRQDIKNRSTTPGDLEDAVIDAMRGMASQVDAVIVLDQVSERNYGVVTDRVRDEIARTASAFPDVVFFGDSRAHIAEFRNIVIKPNQREVVEAVRPGTPADASQERVRDCAATLAARTGKPMFVTLGEAGLLVYADGSSTHVPTISAEGPIDIVGAGDSTTAGIVVALCAGASHVDAAAMGNMVASITIQQIGVTGTASPEQVRERFEIFAARGLAS